MRDHRLRRELDGDQHCPHVDGEREVPVGRVDLQQRSHLQDPGVVDEDVDSAETVDRPPHHVNGRFDICEVDFEGNGIEWRGSVEQAIDVDVEQRQLSTFAAERCSDLCADAAGRASDQRSPSGESALTCPHGEGV